MSDKRNTPVPRAPRFPGFRETGPGVHSLQHGGQRGRRAGGGAPPSRSGSGRQRVPFEPELIHTARLPTKLLHHDVRCLNRMYRTLHTHTQPAYPLDAICTHKGECAVVGNGRGGGGVGGEGTSQEVFRSALVAKVLASLPVSLLSAGWGRCFAAPGLAQQLLLAFVARAAQ